VPPVDLALAIAASCLAHGSAWSKSVCALTETPAAIPMMKANTKFLILLPPRFTSIHTSSLRVSTTQAQMFSSDSDLILSVVSHPTSISSRPDRPGNMIFSPSDPTQRNSNRRNSIFYLPLGTEASPFGDVRILIADDQKDVGRSLADLVRFCNHQVVGIVASGLDAIQAYARYHPDLVLMDHRMPKLNGATACRNILSKDPAARVILVSAWSPSDDASASGAIAMLPKPVSLEQLNAALNKVAETLPALSPAEMPFPDVSFQPDLIDYPVSDFQSFLQLPSLRQRTKSPWGPIFQLLSPIFHLNSQLLTSISRLPAPISRVLSPIFELLSSKLLFQSMRRRILSNKPGKRVRWPTKKIPLKPRRNARRRAHRARVR